ncbi:MAG: hypothetical protein QMB79_01325, partial [Cloacibacterium sp.]
LEPLILEKKLDLKIYNPKEIPEFVKNDLSKNTGVNIISGHSNTNPVLLNELIQQPLFKDIPDEKFNDIYIVNFFENDKKVKVYHLLY